MHLVSLVHWHDKAAESLVTLCKYIFVFFPLNISIISYTPSIDYVYIAYIYLFIYIYRFRYTFGRVLFSKHSGTFTWPCDFFSSYERSTDKTQPSNQETGRSKHNQRLNAGSIRTHHKHKHNKDLCVNLEYKIAYFSGLDNSFLLAKNLGCTRFHRRAGSGNNKSASQRFFLLNGQTSVPSSKWSKNVYNH